MVPTTMVIMAFILLVLSFVTAYLSWKMYRFSSKFNKIWGRAWLLFFLTMLIGIARGGVVIAWALGLIGECEKALRVIDHMLIDPFYAICWLVFLVMMRRWWNIYFSKYAENAGLMRERDNMVTKRENIATQREGAATQREDLASQRETAVLKSEPK